MSRPEKPYSPFGETDALIRQVGVWELGAYDGCNCAHFEVQGVRVEVSCHKSAQSVEVSSTVATDYGANAAMLQAVADEVIRQLRGRVDSEYADKYVSEYTVKVSPS